MHYKNGREITIGDWVVGQTHNSEGRIAVGIVLDLMPSQGTCNVKLRTFPFGALCPMGEHLNGDLCAPFFEHFSAPATVIDQFTQPMRDHTKDDSLWCHVDYADASQLFRVDDAERMANAVYQYGQWNSPYFQQDHQ